MEVEKMEVEKIDDEKIDSKKIYLKIFKPELDEERVTFEMFDEYCKKTYNEENPIYRIIVY